MMKLVAFLTPYMKKQEVTLKELGYLKMNRENY